MPSKTRWRLDTRFVQRVAGEPKSSRVETVPVYVRSIWDNPELFYADPTPMDVRFPIPQPGSDFPFQNDSELGYTPSARFWPTWLAATAGGQGEFPLQIFLLPPNTLEEVLLNGEHTEEFREIGVRLSQAREAARSADGSTLPTWAIPASSWNVSSCELLSEIQRHVLEPVVDGGLTWESGLWTAGEVRAFLNLRIQRFLIETGLLRKEASISVGAGEKSVALPTDLLEIRKVDFLDADGNYHDLSKLDAAQADWGEPDWESTPTEPIGYIEEPLAGLTVKLYPPPLAAGTLVVRYVPLPLQIGATCMPLPLPRTFSWAVKWGTISDMLMKEGEANDPQRAQAAEAQFQMGINMAKLLLGAEV